MHRPVLVKEVLEILSPRPGGHYVDATVNGGGHVFAILEKIGPKGELIGIDRDCVLIEDLSKKIAKLKIKNVHLVCDNFVNIAAIVRRHRLAPLDGLLFDLGFSTYHLEASQRGFSFLKDEPLDMRYNPADTELTAEIILNQWPEAKIERILSEYGEERFSRRIARRIAEDRKITKITRTGDLIKIISRAVPRWYCQGRINCGTRTFQALRITVNDELAFIEKALMEAIRILPPGAKIAVISFHSLEDRIVKRIFQEATQKKEALSITKKAIKPALAEKMDNQRARSAKLRAIKKV